MATTDYFVWASRYEGVNAKLSLSPFPMSADDKLECLCIEIKSSLIWIGVPKIDSLGEIFLVLGEDFKNNQFMGATSTISKGFLETPKEASRLDIKEHLLHSEWINTFKSRNINMASILSL